MAGWSDYSSIREAATNLLRNLSHLANTSEKYIQAQLDELNRVNKLRWDKEDSDTPPPPSLDYRDMG